MCWSHYSPTSSQGRALVEQASQDLPLIFFPYDFLNARKREKYYQQATYEDNFSTCPQPRILFGSQVAAFSRNPSCWSIGSYVPFWQGSHMQKQYHKRTTLHSESSTIKGLLYAPDPEKHEKGTLSDQPGILRVTSMALLCCWGRSCSKIWCPSGLTLRRMPYGRGTLRIPLQRFSLRGRPALLPWAKREEAVIRHATINLIQEFGNPLGIPYWSCSA